MMRRYYILLILMFLGISHNSSAQHYLGVSGGWGSGSIRIFPPEETGMVWGLYSAGVSYKYYGKPNFVGGVGADLLFLQQGFTQMVPIPTDTTRVYQRTVNSIMVPLFWQPHINLFRGHARFFVNLGLTFSYNIDSDYKIESAVSGLIEEGTYEMMLVRDNRWGYGLCGGAGFNVAIGHFEAALEGRYYFGYSDLLRNRNKYETNPLRSPLDNINISMALYYRFGKSVIKPKVPKLKKQNNNDNGNDTPTKSSTPNTEGH